jgi:hypothetical protein
VRSYLTALSAGVSAQYSFVGGQYVDDQYLARVLELLLGTIDHRSSAQRPEMSGLGYVNLLHIAVTLAAIPDTPGRGTPAGAGTASEPTAMDTTPTIHGHRRPGPEDKTLRVTLLFGLGHLLAEVQPAEDTQCRRPARAGDPDGAFGLY